MKKVLDQIEDKCEELMSKQGRLPKIIFLGKIQQKGFIEEMLDLNGITDIAERLEGADQMRSSDILVNDDVRVIFTNAEDELRIDPKDVLLQ